MSPRPQSPQTQAQGHDPRDADIPYSSTDHPIRSPSQFTDAPADDEKPKLHHKDIAAFGRVKLNGMQCWRWCTEQTCIL